MPQVKAGEESSFPLRVRADHFGERFDRWVVKQDELRVGAGNSLLWATRLDSGAPGAALYFKWAGAVPAAGDLTGFCIDPGHKPGGFLMTAKSMHKVVPGR